MTNPRIWVVNQTVDGLNGSDLYLPRSQLDNNYEDGEDGGIRGFFDPLYQTWDAPKILAAVGFLLTQTVGNALLMGIVW